MNCKLPKVGNRNRWNKLSSIGFPTFVRCKKGQKPMDFRNILALEVKVDLRNQRYMCTKAMELMKIEMTETFPSFLLSALALIAVFLAAGLISKLSFLGVVL